MTYKIEKNIPLPKKEHKYKYPLNKMKKGDSFLIKGVKQSSSQIRVLSAAKYMKVKVVTRKVENGLRVWRVK